MHIDDIKSALDAISYPGVTENIASHGVLKDVSVDGDKITITLFFKKDPDPFTKHISRSIKQAVEEKFGSEISEKMEISVEHPQKKEPLNPLRNVNKVIAVSSGKGGVGKSTVSANLAVSLAKLGYKVGLIDSDIYGPSIPKMFGVEGVKPSGHVVDGVELVIPVEKYGVKMLSIGFFVDPNNALIWRGPMASSTLKQLVNQADWGELDFMIIDTPPGTSDIHITLTQDIKLDAAVIVSTPQQVAVIDAAKGVNMYANENINTPVLGLVENMSWFTPAELPDNKYYIFGKDGGKELAEKIGKPLLGQIPIVQSITESGDNGSPIALDEDSQTAKAFMVLAKNVVKEINNL